MSQPISYQLVWFEGGTSVQIALERTTFRMNRDERHLYGAFTSLTLGQFRKLLARATWHEADQPTLLTEEDAVNRRLFYIIDGNVTLQKKGRSFAMVGGTFVGEVSYLLNSNATATAIANNETRYIQWRHKDLQEIEWRHPSIRVALREILNADLASKVADATGGSSQN